MTREQLVEKILDIKREKDWSWSNREQIGGMSPILVVGALLGQMRLVEAAREKGRRACSASPRPKTGC